MDKLWEKVEHQFSYHRKKQDPTGLDALNRVFRKVCSRNFDDLPSGEAASLPTLAPETCEIREEAWSVQEIDQRLTRTHDRKCPTVDGGPLIAVEYHGKTLLVDGHNRANRWIAEGRAGPHSVILLRVR